MPRLSPRPALALAAGCALLVSLGVSGCSDDQAGASTPKPTVTTPTETPTLSEKDAAIESAKEAYTKFNEFFNGIYSNGGDLTKVDPLGDYMGGDALQETIESAANYKSEGKSRTGGLQIVDMSVSEYTPIGASSLNEIVKLKVCLDNTDMHLFTNGIEVSRAPEGVGKGLISVALVRSSSSGPWLVTEYKKLGGAGSC